MLSNKATNTLLVNLKIIGSIRPHERIYSRNGEILDKTPPGVVTGFWRWLTGETREHNLYTVQTVLESAFTYMSMLAERSMSSEPCSASDKMFMARLETDVRAARGGCVNLLTTYESDPVACARIECMLQHIDEHLNNLTPCLEPSFGPSVI